MNVWRLPLASAAIVMLVSAGCSRALPDNGPLAATADKVTVTGQYQRVALDSVERISIENGKLVMHGATGTATVDLPPNADPDQKGRGWALVTEGEGDRTRSLTFTQEMSLEDFTIEVPASEGQLAYGSLGGRDGKDMLLFAYGSGSKAYWGWVAIAPRETTPQAPVSGR